MTTFPSSITNLPSITILQVQNFSKSAPTLKQTLKEVKLTKMRSYNSSSVRVSFARASRQMLTYVVCFLTSRDMFVISPFWGMLLVPFLFMSREINSSFVRLILFAKVLTIFWWLKLDDFLVCFRFFFTYLLIVLLRYWLHLLRDCNFLRFIFYGVNIWVFTLFFFSLGAAKKTFILHK